MFQTTIQIYTTRLEIGQMNTAQGICKESKIKSPSQSLIRLPTLKRKCQKRNSVFPTCIGVHHDILTLSTPPYIPGYIVCSLYLLTYYYRTAFPNSTYPLVNVYIAMENHYFFMGKLTISTGPFFHSYFDITRG